MKPSLLASSLVLFAIMAAHALLETARDALFLPTQRAAKYKAKAAIDTFFVRAGDTIAAIVVGVGLHKLGLHGRQFAVVNLGLIVVWIAIAVGIAHRHRVTAPEVMAPRVPPALQPADAPA